MESPNHKPANNTQNVRTQFWRELRTGTTLDGGLAIGVHMRGKTLGTNQHHSQCLHHLFKIKRVHHKEATFRCWMDKSCASCQVAPEDSKVTRTR